MLFFRLINTIRLIHISIAILVLTLLPFLILCFYNHPSFVDDYCFATKTLEMGLRLAFFDWYNNWTGRYTMCFLMGINPLIIRSFFLYNAILFILISSLPILIFILFKTAFAKKNNGINLSFSALVSFAFFSDLPSIKEGLYWMTGAIAYQLPNLCLIVVLILLIQLNNETGKKITKIIIICFLNLVIIGCNEISMATLTIFFIIISINTYFNNSKYKIEISIIAIINIFASLIVILAPGNEVREQLFPVAENLFWAITMTFMGIGYYFSKWLGITCLIIILSIFVLNNEKINPIKEWFNTSPFLSLIIWSIVIFIGFFVPAWATGQMPNPRAINVLFFIYLIGTFYHIIAFYKHLTTKNKTIEISKIIAIITLFAIIFITFNLDKVNINNIKIAYSDILLGKAYNYDHRMKTLYKTGILKTLTIDSEPTSICNGSENSIKEFSGCPHTYFNNYYK